MVYSLHSPSSRYTPLTIHNPIHHNISRPFSRHPYRRINTVYPQQTCFSVSRRRYKFGFVFHNFVQRSVYTHKLYHILVLVLLNIFAPDSCLYNSWRLKNVFYMHYFGRMAQMLRLLIKSIRLGTWPWSAAAGLFILAIIGQSVSSATLDPLSVSQRDILNHPSHILCQYFPVLNKNIKCFL